jgi:predicted ribosome quality control (RQC) complex YloA/Tae2 family protein
VAGDTAADWIETEMEGYRLLVGRNARANDQLTFGVGCPNDLWFHVAGSPGSHVLVQAPEQSGAVPTAVIRRAAELAAFYSKAGGSSRKVPVHFCRIADVRKERGAPAGQVRLRSGRTIRVYPTGMKEE